MPFLNSQRNYSKYRRSYLKKLRHSLALIISVMFLVCFFLAVINTLHLEHTIAGMVQQPGKAEPGTLAEAGTFARWQEPVLGELSFWACPAAEFPNGYARGSLQFENAAVSPYYLVFELTVTLQDRLELIYRSPSIPPGHMINGAKLKRPLKEGVYQATCIAYAYMVGNSAPAARSEGQTMTITVFS